MDAGGLVRGAYPVNLITSRMKVSLDAFFPTSVRGILLLTMGLPIALLALAMGASAYLFLAIATCVGLWLGGALAMLVSHYQACLVPGLQANVLNTVLWLLLTILVTASLVMLPLAKALPPLGVGISVAAGAMLLRLPKTQNDWLGIVGIGAGILLIAAQFGYNSGIWGLPFMQLVGFLLGCIVLVRVRFLVHLHPQELFRRSELAEQERQARYQAELNAPAWLRWWRHTSDHFGSTFVGALRLSLFLGALLFVLAYYFGNTRNNHLAFMLVVHPLANLNWGLSRVRHSWVYGLYKDRLTLGRALVRRCLWVSLPWFLLAVAHAVSLAGVDQKWYTQQMSMVLMMQSAGHLVMLLNVLVYRISSKFALSDLGAVCFFVIMFVGAFAVLFFGDAVPYLALLSTLVVSGLLFLWLAPYAFVGADLVPPDQAPE